MNCYLFDSLLEGLENSAQLGCNLGLDVNAKIRDLRRKVIPTFLGFPAG